jgi:hypothetical protein
MEYREPPRIAATERRLDGEVDGANPRPRLRRFDFARAERHLDFPRLALTVLLATAAVVVVGYLVTRLSRSAVDWLHHQPQYQLRFLDIELKPPPPPWFRGGAEGFLKQVRENAREAEVLRVLDLSKGEIDKDQIAIDFKKFPWVEDVPRVEYPPHKITVHLAYKTPVAWIGAPPSAPACLDRNGCMLPVADVDADRLGSLIRITGDGLEQASAGNRPGISWRSSSPVPEAGRLEESVEDAAKLSEFFLRPERIKETSGTAALRIIRVNLPIDDRGLWIETKEHAMILWGDAPGKESSDHLKANEKWEILKNWAKSTVQRTLPPLDYWQFSKTELIPVHTDRNRN